MRSASAARWASRAPSRSPTRGSRVSGPAASPCRCAGTGINRRVAAFASRSPSRRRRAAFASAAWSSRAATASGSVAPRRGMAAGKPASVRSRSRRRARSRRRTSLFWTGTRSSAARQAFSWTVRWSASCRSRSRFSSISLRLALKALSAAVKWTKVAWPSWMGRAAPPAASWAASRLIPPSSWISTCRRKVSPAEAAESRSWRENQYCSAAASCPQGGTVAAAPRVSSLKESSRPPRAAVQGASPKTRAAPARSPSRRSFQRRPRRALARVVLPVALGPQTTLRPGAKGSRPGYSPGRKPGASEIHTWPKRTPLTRASLPAARPGPAAGAWRPGRRRSGAIRRGPGGSGRRVRPSPPGGPPGPGARAPRPPAAG